MTQSPKVDPPLDSNDTAKRLPASERRRQIVRTASQVLAERGIDHVRMPEVAERAGVTRAIVYRFFANRQELLAAILVDFREEIERRYKERSSLLREGRPIDVAVRGFIAATCDAIDTTGAGGFVLLNMDGPDPELAELARATRESLHAPWLARISNVTDVDRVMATAISAMSVASSRAVIALYLDRTITRDQAADVLARGVAALLAEFRR